MDVVNRWQFRVEGGKEGGGGSVGKSQLSILEVCPFSGARASDVSRVILIKPIAKHNEKRNI